MKITEILVTENAPPHYINIIKQQCFQFLEESYGFPLYKSLPSTYQDFQKVKVRYKKQNSIIGETFNSAFDSQISQRAVFANGGKTFHRNEGENSFYIFPINGYRYLYSSEVENSNLDYQAVFDSLCEKFDTQKTMDIVTEMMRYTYTDNNLSEGISNGCEIILFDIPYYYAVRANVDYMFT